MNEERWLTGSDGIAMVEFLARRNASRRKARLFLAALARADWDRLPPELQDALLVGERWADGLVSEAERSAAEERATPVEGEADLEHQRAGIDLELNRTSQTLPLATEAELAELEAAVSLTNRIAEASRMALAAVAGDWNLRQLRYALRDMDQSRVVAFLRDVYGNPFRPVTFLPEWRTSTVLALAEGIYAERAFDRMPILADALRDANCWDEQVLGHCAEPLHTRGCFVIDGLTGRN